MSRQKTTITTTTKTFYFISFIDFFYSQIHGIRMCVQMLHIGKNSYQWGSFFKSFWGVRHDTGSFYEIINSEW